MQTIVCNVRVIEHGVLVTKMNNLSMKGGNVAN